MPRQQPARFAVRRAISTAIVTSVAAGLLVAATATAAYAAPGDYTAYSTHSADPVFVAVGPGGNPWFIGQNSGSIGFVDDSTGVTTTYNIAAGIDEGLVLGPDGNMWFADEAANTIDEFNVTTHVVTTHTVPTTNASPFSLAFVGNVLWFTERTGGHIATFTPSTSSFAEYGSFDSSSTQLGEVALAPNGTLWFVVTGPSVPFAVGGIASIDPTAADPSSTITSIPGSDGGDLYGLVVSSDGRVWVDDPTSSSVNFYDPGTASWTTGQELIPGEVSFLFAAPDGKIWYSNYGSSSSEPGGIGFVDPTTGDPTYYPVPVTAQQAMSDIVLGGDGNLWVGAWGARQIWRFELAHPVFVTTSLPAGVPNKSYSATVVATGTSTVSYALVGSLPPGLTLDSATGAIKGTPTATGHYSFSITATDADGSSTRAFSIVVRRVLAETGVDERAPLLGGLALLLLGCAVVLIGRRRRAAVSA